MQEDFGFLNANGCYSTSEKPSTSVPNHTLDLDAANSSSFTKTTSQAAKVKLEESPDINKWPFNYGINFL